MKRIKKHILFLMLLVFLVSLSGCWFNQAVDKTEVWRQNFKEKSQKIHQLRDAVYGTEKDGTAGKTKIWLYLKQNNPQIVEQAIIAWEEYIKIEKALTNASEAKADSTLSKAFKLFITGLDLYNSTRK